MEFKGDVDGVKLYLQQVSKQGSSVLALSFPWSSLLAFDLLLPKMIAKVLGDLAVAVITTNVYNQSILIVEKKQQN